MLTTLGHRGALGAFIPIAAVGSLLALTSAPCRGDVAPESALLVHVQPVSGSCETPIIDCTEIIRSTRADGLVEFLIFFMRGIYWPGEEICLGSLDNVLSWPETWQLVEFEPCGLGIGSLDPTGATHALHLEWWHTFYRISDLPRSVVPVARLVMNVVGPGRLDIVARYGENPVELALDCQLPTFVTYPVQVYAEAGMECGYISAHCAYDEEKCAAHYSVEELLLSAPLQGVADTTIEFYSINLGFAPCDVTIGTHAPWCTAWEDSVMGDPWHRDLHVAADAAGLPLGMYETEIEILFDDFYGPPVSRCLPVQFNVGEMPTPIVGVSWGRIKALYRLAPGDAR